MKKVGANDPKEVDAETYAYCQLFVVQTKMIRLIESLWDLQLKELFMIKMTTYIECWEPFLIHANIMRLEMKENNLSV